MRHTFIYKVMRTQDYRFWTTENPHKIEKSSFQQPKVTAWCAVSGFKTTWSDFFESEHRETKR